MTCPSELSNLNIDGSFWFVVTLSLFFKIVSSAVTVPYNSSRVVDRSPRKFSIILEAIKFNFQINEKSRIQSMTKSTYLLEAVVNG